MEVSDAGRASVDKFFEDISIESGSVRISGIPPYVTDKRHCEKKI